MVYREADLHTKRILNACASFLLLACLGAALCYGSRRLETAFAFKKERLLYVPPARYLAMVSGTFKGLFADLFYVNGVLAVTDEIEDRITWVDWVQKNFKVATDLDPGLTQGFFFGGVIVGRDRPGIEKGIRFLEESMKKYPDCWELPYWIGFDYFQLGEYLKAVPYYEKASSLPDAPEFLKSIQPMYYYKGGRPDLGLLYLQGLAHSIKDPRQLEWIKTKQEWLKNIVALDELVGKFKERFGRQPLGLGELVKEGMLKAVPEDPFGKGYYLDKDSGEVKSRFQADQKR